MTKNVVPYDEAMADLYRENPDLAIATLNEAIKEGDSETFMTILGHIVKSTSSVATLARQTSLNENTLHRTLSSHGNPTLKTLLNIFESLNLQLTVTRANHDSRKGIEAVVI